MICQTLSAEKFVHSQSGDCTVLMKNDSGGKQEEQMKDMEFKKAEIKHTDGIYHIVQTTIKTIYPRYYPQEVVEFFCQLHSREHIVKDIQNATTSILRVQGQLVGTGSREGNHITRVYVLPEFQGRGYGSYLMQCLEDQIAATHPAVLLDASLPASRLYEHRGYHTIRHEQYPVEHGAVLVYEIMEKVF